MEFDQKFVKKLSKISLNTVYQRRKEIKQCNILGVNCLNLFIPKDDEKTCVRCKNATEVLPKVQKESI